MGRFPPDGSVCLGQEEWLVSSVTNGCGFCDGLVLGVLWTGNRRVGLLFPLEMVHDTEKLREQGLDPDSISKEQEEQRKRELVVCFSTL